MPSAPVGTRIRRDPAPASVLARFSQICGEVSSNCRAATWTKRVVDRISWWSAWALARPASASVAACWARDRCSLAWSAPRRARKPATRATARSSATPAREPRSRRFTRRSRATRASVAPRSASARAADAWRKSDSVSFRSAVERARHSSVRLSRGPRYSSLSGRSIAFHDSAAAARCRKRRWPSTSSSSQSRSRGHTRTRASWAICTVSPSMLSRRASTSCSTSHRCASSAVTLSRGTLARTGSPSSVGITSRSSRLRSRARWGSSSAS